jgi:hypothetical protein
MVHLLDRRSSCGQPIIITGHTAESLAPADRRVHGEFVLTRLWGVRTYRDRMTANGTRKPGQSDEVGVQGIPRGSAQRGMNEFELR